MNPYLSVRNNKPSRSSFDLSYSKVFNATFGTLYPVMCDEMVPGDIFKIKNRAFIRTQPLFAPILHQIDVSVHYFFVPYRILFDRWEEFITGGEDGYRPVSTTEITLPVWIPAVANDPAVDTLTDVCGPGTLWDFLGMPPALQGATLVDRDHFMLDFPRRAYNLIWYEYYRDQNWQVIDPSLVTPVSDKNKRDFFVFGGHATTPGGGSAPYVGNQLLLNRNWEKDYFTSCLPWQQKGDAPSLDVSGTGKVVFAQPLPNAGGTNVDPLQIQEDSIVANPKIGSLTAGFDTIIGTNFKNWLNFNNTVDFSSAVGFDIADLRLAFQVQRWLEQTARSGSRYIEFLKGHFGVSPSDSRLQRPEYVGGTKMPLIVSEVLDQSGTSTGSSDPGAGQVGSLHGHAISAGGDFVGTYHAEEHGVILGLMSIMPRPGYQQGINRQWLRRTPLDFYFPEFAHLSEREILSCELYWDPSGTSASNGAVFGYQGMFDEMRVKHNMVHGTLREDFDFWHLNRIFKQRPTMGSDFLTVRSTSDETKERTLQRPFPVVSETPFFVSWGNSISAIRPMPIMPDPGLIDHV